MKAPCYSQYGYLGYNKWEQASVNEVAEKTLKCLLATVPNELPGIVFLSGGQSDIDATAPWIV